jgi:putative transposase
MRRAYAFRMFTNPRQERELDIALETRRRLYNTYLDYREMAYRHYGTSLSDVDCSRWFKVRRRTNPYLARINFSGAQATMRRLDKAFAAFYRRVKAGEDPGFPRFKGRGRFDSIEFPAYGDGVKLVGGKLRVQHVGMIRIKLHRPIEGRIKSVTLKRVAGKWYAIFSCDLGDVAVAPSPNPPVGIESFLTTSDGEHEPNPAYHKTALPELRRAQRAPARKRKGGKNRRKSKHQLAEIHARVRRLRHEHHHQVALKLVRRYGLIAVEGLGVENLLKNGRLARAISDAGWSGFLLTSRSKAESAGVAYVEVDPRGTSQLCSGCGGEVRKELSVRRHDCPHCGLPLHRDENAARNILARGLRARIGPAGLNVGHEVKRAPEKPPPAGGGVITELLSGTKRQKRQKSRPGQGSPSVTGFGWKVEYRAGLWGTDMNGAFDHVALGLNTYPPDIRGWARW